MILKSKYFLSCGILFLFIASFSQSVAAYENIVIGIYEMNSEKPVKIVNVDGITKLKVMDTKWTCLARKETSFVKAIKGESLAAILRCESKDSSFFTNSVVCTKSKFEMANAPIASTEFYIGDKKRTYKISLSCSMMSDDEIQFKIDQVKKQSK